MERIAKLPKKALILRNVIGAFIVFNLFVAIPFAQKGVESPKLKTVVIDAGHGGKDPGCHGGYAHEKDVCLSMALKLGKLINEKYPTITVKYTRETDVFVELIERANIANRATQIYLFAFMPTQDQRLPTERKHMCLACIAPNLSKKLWSVRIQLFP